MIGRVLSFALGCAVLLGASPQPGLSNPQQWKEFTSAEGAFSILMPGTPERSLDAIEGVGGMPPNKVVTFTSKEGGFTYWIDYIEYPGGLHGPIDSLLDAGRDGALEATAGTLLKETCICAQGYPGREYVVRLPSGMLITRSFLVRTRLYSMGVVVPEERSPTKELLGRSQRFFDSFKLLEPHGANR